MIAPVARKQKPERRLYNLDVFTWYKPRRQKYCIVIYSDLGLTVNKIERGSKMAELYEDKYKKGDETILQGM
jgi:hypothetical protein